MKAKIILSSLFLLCFFSCENDCFMQHSDCDNVSVIDHSFKPLRIKSDIETLTQEDALIVASIGNQFFPSEIIYPKGDPKGVVPVSLNDTLVLYAVNYDDGFVLVSSTKKAFPILAVVGKGTYTNENAVLPASYIIDEIAEYVKASISDKNTTDRFQAWSFFEESRCNLIETRSEGLEDIFPDCRDDWMDHGWNVYLLASRPQDMDYDLYLDYKDYAYENNMSSNNYLYSNVILERTTVTPYNFGPYLSTQWNQNYPYNTLIPNNNPLGCVTIACGQLMRYYEHPATIAWNNMPDYTTTPNDTLNTFLKNLHDDLLVTPGGSSSIYIANIVLSAFGYNCQIINHSVGSVYTSLLNGNPVYMRGEDNNLNSGHAWVCDGIYGAGSRTEYALMMFNPGDGDGPHFEEALTDEFISSYSYEHMNWGWGGNHDGYFLDTNIGTLHGSDVWNFSSSRKDLLIYGHN